MNPPASLADIRSATAKAAWEAYQRPEFRDTVAPVDKTALRNLLAAAGEAEVLEELYILFEYQVGRKVLQPALRDLLRDAIEAQVQALRADQRADEVARLEVARTWLQHVVRLHRAIAEERPQRPRAPREPERPQARGRDLPPRGRGR